MNPRATFVVCGPLIVAGHVWSLFQAATSEDKKPGTNVTMTTPPLVRSS